MSANDPGFIAALEEAKQGFAEGGVPIGACLVAADGKILGRGHNMRVQKGSAILHGETSALENAGRLPASAYKGSTMYTTLSPCDMCTGACILYKVSRVVMGEHNTFVGGEEHLKRKGIEVINLQNAEAEQLMKDFIKAHPEDWFVIMRG
ncbi:Putative cytidine and deoxycytidylate deaminase domain, cytidine deaminase [Septoria linicola]|uniref:Cytosine deaminase n=1 Tax=Septoria linicola TaxID=215465 RepID=A0A9Q9AY28_9PEZI|nr:Putative cytidine and deoxycytidylate deaminase domain, cytidine deaminase [Septoria linicola]